MRFAPLLLAAFLLGCAQSTQTAQQAVESAAAQAAGVVDAAQEQAGGVQAAGAAATAPAVLALREAIEEVAPPAPQVHSAQHAALEDAAKDPGAVIITKYEIVSDGYYERALKAIYCPRGNTMSGPTGGIGYDFGHQTAREIRAVWGWHPQVEAMVAASGQVGTGKCVAWRKRYGRVLIDLADAKRVFAVDSLPKYRHMAERALPGLVDKTKGHIGGVTSTGYRRGWAMVGARNLEKRAIRDECMPIASQAESAECSALQTIAMCRIWKGTDTYKGQCRRSHDEAAVIRS